MAVETPAYGVELLFFHEQPAQLLVRPARPEQHAVGHDHRRAAARFQEAQEEREEEQLGLLRLDNLQQVLGRVLVVEAPGERRIGQHQRVGLLVARVVLRERVAIADVRVLHAV